MSTPASAKAAAWSTNGPGSPSGPRRICTEVAISAGSRPTAVQCACRTSRLWRHVSTSPPAMFQYWAQRAAVRSVRFSPPPPIVTGGGGRRTRSGPPRGAGRRARGRGQRGERARAPEAGARGVGEDRIEVVEGPRRLEQLDLVAGAPDRQHVGPRRVLRVGLEGEAHGPDTNFTPPRRRRRPG